MAALCDQCGGRLTLEGDEAICPSCLFAGMDEPPPVEDMETVFPDITMGRLLGRGGMGCVYEAVQSPLNRTVAVKILPMEGRTDRAEVEERFLREGRALAKLDHPHIVAVHQFGEASGWLYLVMEFVAGQDLAKKLSAGPLPWRDACTLARQLCSGLEAAHALSIVHRDIKPGNLLLTEQGNLKIADFGLAKLHRDEASSWTLTKLDSTMGTPFYMAPEQRRLTAEVDARADIYSAGVVLYEMLTGGLPMGNYRKASQISGAPATVDAVIEKALATEPGERWQSAAEMRRALEAATAPARPRRWLWPAAAAVLAVTAAVLQSAGVFPPPPATDHGKATPAPSGPAVLYPGDGIRLTAPEPGGLFGTMAVSERDILVISRPGLDHFGQADSCTGEVWVYPVDEGGVPGTPVRLQAEHPQVDDNFGLVIDIDPAASIIAVTLPTVLPQQPEPGDRRQGAVEIYRRRSPAGNEWDRTQTIWMDRDFIQPAAQIRAFVGPGVLAVASPTHNHSGSVRLYRDRDGVWEFDCEIQSELARGTAYFGWYVDPDEPGNLLISACRHNEGAKIMQGAISSFIRDASGRWTENQLITDPAGRGFAVFGMAFLRRGDQLWSGAMGDHYRDVAGAGNVLVYERAGADAPWQFVRKFGMPEVEPGRGGFGQRLGLSGDITAVSATRGEVKGEGRSVIYFMRNAAGDAPETVATLESRSMGEVWRGRCFYSDRLFAFGHPRESGPGDKLHSGAVYVFPRSRFPQLFGKP